MKINDLELFLVAIRLDELKQTVRSLLVRLVTDTGMEGWGEASSNWQESELVARQNALLAVLKGRNIFDIEELHTLDVSVFSQPAVRRGDGLLGFVGQIGTAAVIQLVRRHLSPANSDCSAFAQRTAGTDRQNRPGIGRTRFSQSDNHVWRSCGCRFARFDGRSRKRGRWSAIAVRRPG